MVVSVPCGRQDGSPSRPGNASGLDAGDTARDPRAKGNVFRGSELSPVEPMRRKDILRRLEERLARGEISETTYLEIKARYESEPEEPEESLPPTMSDLG